MGVSYNVAKSVTCSITLQAVIDDIQMHVPNWWFIYMPECDGDLR